MGKIVLGYFSVEQGHLWGAHGMILSGVNPPPPHAQTRYLVRLLLQIQLLQATDLVSKMKLFLSQTSIYC